MPVGIGLPVKELRALAACADLAATIPTHHLDGVWAGRLYEYRHRPGSPMRVRTRDGRAA